MQEKEKIMQEIFYELDTIKYLSRMTIFFIENKLVGFEEGEVYSFCIPFKDIQERCFNLGELAEKLNK